MIIFSFREYGIRNKSSSLGGSVAKAKAASVSMMRLTHNICTGVKGDSLIITAPKNAMKIATILTVSWNCKNFLMQSKIFLPYLIAVMMLPKLSSKRIMPAAYLATYVPAMPIANPISDFLRAGASLVPSPVMATTWPICFKPVDRIYLSSGDERANTLNSFTILVNYFIFFTYYLSASSAFTNPSTLSRNYLPYITENYPGWPFAGLV